MSNNDIKKYIDLSKLYSEVDFEQNTKVEEGFVDWVKTKLGIDDKSAEKDLENLLGDVPKETKKDLDKAADNVQADTSKGDGSGSAADTSKGDGSGSVKVTTQDQANSIFQNPNATDAERQAAQEFYGKEKTTSNDQPEVDTDAGANAQANISQNDTSSNDQPEVDTDAGANAQANISQNDTSSDASPNIAGNNFATDADGNTTRTDDPRQPDEPVTGQDNNPNTDGGQASDPDANDPRGDQTNPPANTRGGTPGPDNAPQGQDNNPNAEVEPQAEPVNTKDLMTRYNEGGKKAMPEIKKLQTELSRLGFDPNGIDGKYGNGTFKAVQDFQKANGLQVDGQAGTDTLAAIKKAITGDGPGKGEAGAGDGAGQSAQASNDAQATDDGMTDAEREAGAGKGGGADAMDPKNQQQDIDTAQPNADLDRYIALLNKLEGGQVNAGTPDATQGKVFASYDFRDLIALVESNLLNEKLTPAEMEELKSLHNKVQGHVGIPGMDDQKIVNALNRYLKLVKEPADKKADAQTKASDAQLIAKGQAAKADAQNKASDAQLIAKAQAAQPKVSKELYVQMPPNRKASLGNFNVSKMKAKYPKPYVDIPNKDGTITRGYGPLKNLEDFVANQGKKFKAKIIGKPAQQAGVPNAERDGAERGVQTASKDNNMKKAIEEASMNISINGDSAAEVAELAGILKNAGMHDAKPVSDILPHADNSHDDMMSKMAIVNEPEMDSPCGMDEEGVEEDWDNSPDESYADTQTMTKDLSGGLNRQKKAYAKAQDGDNAMAVETSIKEQLWAALNEKMTAEGRGRGKTLKASRGEKLNASRGNKLMASRGKNKKTTEGSRGKKSRGKKSRG